MNWPLLLLLLAFITAYAWLRNRVRRWIVDQWVANRMDNRQVAWLLVASYTVPIGAVGIWVGATTPDTAPTASRTACAATARELEWA